MPCRLKPARRLDELKIHPLTHELISNRLINLVARRVGRVGVEETELAALVEHLLRQRRDKIAGVAAPAKLRWRVDRVDAHAVGRSTRPASDGDRPGIFPEMVLGV